jgi:hypothetical protein
MLLTRVLWTSVLSAVVLQPALLRSVHAQTVAGTTGRYKIVMEMDASLPDHTIYRPVDLAEIQHPLPIVAFANGACANAGNAFQGYLAEIASHGFLVVADGPIDPSAPGRPPQPGSPSAEIPSPAAAPGSAKPPVIPFIQSKTSQMFETMDWAQSQSQTPSSKYFSKLDPGLLAVMGQSCGGLQALVAAADARVRTAVIFNSGVIRRMPPMPGGSAAPEGAPRLPTPPMSLPGSPEMLKLLHTPLIYIIGGETDIAYKNSETDFDQIEKVPVFNANLTGVGHNGTLWQPHGGKFAEVATGWLLWQLKGDASAGALFIGPACGLCHDPDWKVKVKNFAE